MSIFHQDGIVDLIAGAVMLNFGLDLLNQSTSTSLFTWIPLLLLPSMKKRITIPRIGYASLKTNEKKVGGWITQTAISMVIALVLLSIMVFSDPLGLQKQQLLPWFGDMRSLVIGSLLSIFCLVAALGIPLKRFYIYSAVALVCGIIGFFLQSANVAAFIPSAALLGVGIWLLTRFMRKYPMDEKENKPK